MKLTSLILVAFLILSSQTFAAFCERTDEDIAYKNTRSFFRIKKQIEVDQKVSQKLKKEIDALIQSTRLYYMQSKCSSLRQQQMGLLIDLRNMRNI